MIIYIYCWASNDNINFVRYEHVVEPAVAEYEHLVEYKHIFAAQGEVVGHDVRRHEHVVEDEHVLENEHIVKRDDITMSLTWFINDLDMIKQQMFILYIYIYTYICINIYIYIYIYINKIHN